MHARTNSVVQASTSPVVRSWVSPERYHLHLRRVHGRYVDGRWCTVHIPSLVQALLSPLPMPFHIDVVMSGSLLFQPGKLRCASFPTVWCTGLYSSIIFSSPCTIIAPHIELELLNQNHCHATSTRIGNTPFP